MNRKEMAETIASVARMAADLVAEAESEIAAKEFDSHREEIAARDFVEKKLREELADYERTVAVLREQLRAEEARCASYQAVDGAARRFVARFREENPRAGWKAGWRCPAPEMQQLLDVIDPVEGAKDPHPLFGS